MGIIYKITNPTGKVYVGKTTDWKQRYRRYKNLTCKNQKAIYNSLLKYGYENHTFEILMSDIQEDHLVMWEQVWIWVEDSFGNGLNLTPGGDGFLSGERNPMYGKAPYNKGKKASDELKLKLSLAHKGQSLSEETKRKLSERNEREKHLDEGQNNVARV